MFPCATPRTSSRLGASPSECSCFFLQFSCNRIGWGMPRGADAFIQVIAKKAGVAALRRFGKVGIKYMKSDALWDCVTEADLVSNRIMVSAIKKKYPTHGIISEESGSYNPDV